MYALFEMMDAIQGFMETGGNVLQWIALLIFVMWILIFERISFLKSGYKKYEKDIIAQWEARRERKSWNAHQIRQAYISRASNKLNQNLMLLGALVALCPLLGLMGTVTGMIEVFDVMAITGSGSARSMASGVSKATIPTMAGMVGALSGVFASTWLNRMAKRETELLEDHLTMDH
ncbi:MotA/TolQ/ExbB proton channel family protein [Catenovulum sediminis]|uniref:MotA/TolQ/ExbB proton channel family protein n=1 Tax=Catenovulum sediminis TaxID=1740262 RepID=A0ABV1RMQ9_9ALTE|nr:MotA/TolQ/ExbB proton channel family protein [Catenovulum sediminis]